MSTKRTNGAGEAPLEKAGIRTVKVLSVLVDLVVLLLFLLVMVYGIYTVWDETRVFETGSSKTFETYKPTTEDTLSFEELQGMNSDVFGWLQVYGTPVDYPVVQGENLHDYLNLDAAGNFTLSGSIFLDPQNNRHFTDTVSIIYGHHMDKDLMFGSLDHFVEQEYFEEHPYGDLFFDGKNHGLEFFAVVIADAYDLTVYNTSVSPGEYDTYISGLLEKAVHTRDIHLQQGEKVVLLSTCASGTSNSRYLLAARMTDETFENTFAEEESTTSTLPLRTRAFLKEVPLWWWVALIAAILLLILLLVLRDRRRKHETREKQKEEVKRQ